MSNDSVRRGWLNRLASESCKKLTCLLRPHSHYIVDRIILSFRKPFLSFYICLLLI